MKIKKIYISLEGVLADFAGKVKELWGVSFPPESCTSLDEEYRFWDMIRNEKHFYERLDPLSGSLEMFRELYEKYKSACEIVSETHITYNSEQGEIVFVEGDKEIADKIAWIHKYLPENIESNLSFSFAPYYKDAGFILIDCREEKIKKWHEEGGTGIIHISPQKTLRRIKDIEESFCRENKKLFADKLDQVIQECKKKAAQIEALYKRGLMGCKDERGERVQIAGNAWQKIKEFCRDEKIDLGNENDNIYQSLYEAVGFHIKKVPVRYYPTVELMTGSLYYIYGLENEETLFNDENPIGKTFKFKKSLNMGREKVLADYYFKIENEDYELEKKGASWEGWKCYEGYGKLEGYQWAGASIHVREYNGEIQSVALQKIYLRPSEPIWKRCSAYPVEGHRWVGIYEDIPDDLIIPEGDFYSDATLDPPRGRHYREQGILAYDDTEEIVILGIKDSEAEIVEIPREINGKQVTVLDEGCFGNCRETLRKVILPDTLKEIGDYAFEYCEKLEKPVIPASVTKIGKDLFGRV